MKKIIFAALFLLFLTGCTANEAVKAKPAVRNTFACTAKIETGELKAEAVIERFEDGRWSIEFSEPKTLSGVRLDFSEDEVKASYKGLEFSIPKDALPLKASLSTMFDVLDKLIAAGEMDGKAEDEQIIVEGETEKGGYILKFDNSTYELLAFELPALELKVSFGKFNESVPTETSTSETVTETSVSSEAVPETVGS